MDANPFARRFKYNDLEYMNFADGHQDDFRDYEFEISPDTQKEIEVIESDTKDYMDKVLKFYRENVMLFSLLQWIVIIIILIKVSRK